MRFRIAETPAEHRQIQEILHQVFVEEIPQHRPAKNRRLVDQFDAENVYLIGVAGSRVRCVVAMRDRRPFSLDRKLPNLDDYLPPHKRACEIRLLAILRSHRNTRVFGGLLREVVAYCDASEYDLALVSGTLRQVRLYRHLGFTAFGPVVGTSEAPFQPMFITREAFRRVRGSLHLFGRTQTQRAPVNLLPGPVAIRPEVRRALATPAISHRGDEFRSQFESACQMLRELTGTARVQLLSGGGTLACDAVAAQLAVEGSRGLVLANGEFGERLIHHATGAGLSFQVVRSEWGKAFEAGALDCALRRWSDLGWVWAVHCETSTGVLNDLQMVSRTCTSHGVKLAVDCTSSIGTVPLDLSGVQFATGVSGKALGGFPGLGFVFHNHALQPHPDEVPRALDLGVYEQCDGIPFTISSNLVRALHAALSEVDWEDRYARINATAEHIAQRLTEAGWGVVAPPKCRAPAVLTLEVPNGENSVALGRSVEAAGFWLSYRSEYLVRHNWVQICLMGEMNQAGLERLLALLDGFRERPGKARGGWPIQQAAGQCLDPTRPADGWTGEFPQVWGA